MLLFIALAAVAADPPAESRTILYFPTKVGTKWEYTHPRFDQTMEIRSVKEKDGAKYVTAAVVMYPKRRQRIINSEEYAVSEKGLFNTKSTLPTGNPVIFDPPLCLLKLPNRPGQTWEVNVHQSPGPAGAGVKGTFTMRESEAVEVPAGKYMAVRVDFTGVHDDQVPDKHTRWFAPDVGLVKMVIAGGSNAGELVLKSFTPGK
jgi:hypothetical protein